MCKIGLDVAKLSVNKVNLESKFGPLLYSVSVNCSSHKHNGGVYFEVFLCNQFRDMRSNFFEKLLDRHDNHLIAVYQDIMEAEQRSWLVFCFFQSSFSRVDQLQCANCL